MEAARNAIGPVVVAQTVEATPGPDQNTYRMLLASLVFPLAGHLAFNAVAAFSILLIGHPVTAAAFLVCATSVDFIQQRLVKRWISQSPATDPDAGLRRVARLSFVRVSIYIAPAMTMVIATRGLAELAFFSLQFATLLTLALGAGLLSRRIFWSLCAPLLIAIIILCGVLFSTAQLLAIALGVCALAGMLVMVSESTLKAIATWHAAYLANIALVFDLAAARDQAVADGQAADVAREVARSASKAKSNFLATMSHEIRTPMNGVLGMAQLLKRDEIDPTQIQRLDVLIDSGEYLLAILNDILDVSKIDAGKLELAPASEDIGGLLEKLVSFWSARADEKGVRLTLQVGPDVPKRVMVDALRLRQVMFNLVGNALKFTEHGSIDIIADAADRGGGMVDLHVAIRDTGPGIAEQHLAVLFDRFSQVDEAEARRFSGTGLGLAIVKQLVELMGGRVWVDSVVGDGSTFHIEIPVNTMVAAVEDEPDTEASAEPMEPLRMLAVDDNPTNLLVLEQLLNSLGHDVAKAASGAQALEALAAQAFDLVLTDIHMPEMTGTQLLHRLRDAPGPNQSVPVLALTADVTSGGRQRYLEEGFTEHAVKPIQLKALLEAMARALNAPPIAAVITSQSGASKLSR